MDEITKKIMIMDVDERANLYKTVFSDPSGKLVLEDLRTKAYRYDNPAKPDPDGPVLTALDMSFNCGMLAVLQHIETHINHEPETKKEGEN